MKNIYIIFSLTLLSLFASHSAHATVDTVTVQDNPSHFLPVTLYAVIGDTIRWTWIEGNHVVGAVNASDIPNGASNWNGTIDASHHTFDYVVTVAGNYHYECHPAFHMENLDI